MARPLRSLLLAALLASPAFAQPSAPITPGDIVKVRTLAGADRFRVVELDARRLTLQDLDDSIRTVSLDEIRSLWVSRGLNTPLQGAKRGFFIGAIAGAAMGAFGALTSERAEFLSLPPPPTGLATHTATAAVFVGLIGGTIGLAVGATRPGARWERVPVASLRPVVTGSGAVGFGVRVRF